MKKKAYSKAIGIFSVHARSISRLPHESGLVRELINERRREQQASRSL